MKVTKLQRYLNPVAQLHLLSKAPYNILVAGRGFSKSFTNGLKQANKVALMPRSVGLFNSPTYQMIYTKTLIPMKAAWEQHMGYIEDLHYVVGKVPPKHFARPYHKPHRYENVVTFWNGRTIIFGSFDRAQFISGGSYDDVDTDESYMIKKEDYDNFVIPTVRGTHPSFKDCPIHLQQTHTSSMPYRNQGEFLLEYYFKAKSDPKHYSFQGWEPNAKFQKGSTWMNVRHLGRKAIEQMIMEMDKHAVTVMIDNQMLTSYGNLFYPGLSHKHFYTPVANDKVIFLPLNSLNFKRDASHDIGKDNYDVEKPLNISHDFGKFNCIWIDQEHLKEIRFINTMYTYNGGDTPKDLDDLADEFGEYYKDHRNKLVYQWGDKSGNNAQANSKKNYFEQFADRLRAKGWRVIRKKTGDVEHLERFRFIAKLHKEEDPRFPKIRHNATNCADARISLEAAQMVGDKKDKRSEVNLSIKPQHATHFSDAYDYRLYHGLQHLERGSAADSRAYTTSLG